MLSRLVEDVLNPSDLDGPENSQDQSNSRKISRRGALAGGLVAAMSAVAGAANAQSRMTPQRAPGSRPPNNNGFGGGVSGGGVSSGSAVYSGGLVSGGSGNNPAVNTQRTWQDADLKLLRRINYGPTPADVAELKAIGYTAYLEKQMNPASIEDTACEARVQQFSPYLYDTFVTLNQQPWWSITGNWNDAVIVRSIYSKRQLQQRMLEFWMDHFYVDSVKVPGPVILDYYRSISQECFGTFRELLKRSANHGAMMIYLDNLFSTATLINVNYAREILELHTVGVNGGYTEADIYQVADAFTGWSVVEDGNPNENEFVFKPSLHMPGTRTIMQKSFPQSGKAQGDAVLDWLATHPSTIKYIGNKLTRFFLGKDASPALMSKIQSAWGANGDIKAVLREILSRTEIINSVPKFKRPNHLVYGSIRQLGLNLTYISGIYSGHLVKMNMAPFKWFQPDGYPDAFEYWAGGMVRRIRFVQEINSNSGLIQLMDVSAMLSMDDAARVTEINSRLFLGELPVTDQVWIRRYLKGKSGHEAMRSAISLAMAGSSYQWY
ncbi:MAG: DUF1800 domain-containing protein [Fimbriimonadaceae bacterium]|nr:DUF1800 domain-containing protein [Fimbriimonadaceae bacterium]